MHRAKTDSTCSHRCARLFTAIDNSAPARQAPQIFPTLTPAREMVFHSIHSGYADSSPGVLDLPEESQCQFSGAD